MRRAWGPRVEEPNNTLLCPTPLGRIGIMRCFCLTSVAYIGNKSRTERPSMTKIGTQVAHVTRDSDTTFKVKRWKVKVTRNRQLQWSAWECIERGKLLIRYRLQARRREALRRPHWEERGGGISCRHAHSLFLLQVFCRVIGFTGDFCPPKTSADICVVHDDLGWKNRTTRYNRWLQSIRIRRHSLSILS